VVVTESDQEERRGKIGGIAFVGLVKGVKGVGVDPATNVGTKQSMVFAV